MRGHTAYKSLEMKGLSQRMWCARTDFYGIRTPTFMAYEPPLLRHMNRFYWGWGWSLICWKFVPAIVLGGSSQGLKNFWKVVKICLKISVFDNFFTNLCKKYDPKICHKMRGHTAYKSLEMKGLSQRMWCARTDFYGIRAPTFMAYEPPLLRHMNRFYWGWGWSLICWKFVPAIVLGGSSQGLKNFWKVVKICLKISVFDNFSQIFANMTPKYAIKWGVIRRTNPLKWRDFHRECGARTDFYGIRTPTFMAYEPPLLRHMNRFYWGWGWSLICWKFVPAIVLGGSSQGLKNLWKVVKICLKISGFWQFFHKFLRPDWNPQKQSLGQILDNFGVRGVFECCKGKKVSQHLKGSKIIQGLTNGWFSKRVVLADVPPEQKPERGYIRMFTGTKAGARVHSHFPLEQKPERGYIRQNHPFTKPPFCLPVRYDGSGQWSKNRTEDQILTPTPNPRAPH